MATISNKIWDLNKELWEHPNNVLHKNDNAVRTLENERLWHWHGRNQTDTATISTSHGQDVFPEKTLIKIRKKKFPQKRKWYGQATVILRDYMKGSTSGCSRTIRSYLLGKCQQIPERRTLQTTLTNRPTDRATRNERLAIDNVPD